MCRISLHQYLPPRDELRWSRDRKVKIREPSVSTIRQEFDTRHKVLSTVSFLWLYITVKVPVSITNGREIEYSEMQT